MGHSLQWGRQWCVSLKDRCVQNELTIHAGYLAYVTLLSLVPLVTVSLGVFSVFPIFSRFKDETEAFIVSNFLPTSGTVIQTHIDAFAENASHLTFWGLCFLLLVAFLLMANVDRTLNRIWHGVSGRGFVKSVAVYLLVLILGPIMLGLSIGLTSYISVMAASADPGLPLIVFKAAAMMVSTVTFAILYKVVPNVPVSFKPALVGAVSAGFLFEIFKKLFGLYLSYFPTYQLIYGALATIPILFVWIYASWIIVLLGAEVTVTTECMINDG